MSTDIRHAKACARRKAALLLPLSALSGLARRPLYEDASFPLRTVYVFDRRLPGLADTVPGQRRDPVSLPVLLQRGAEARQGLPKPRRSPKDPFDSFGTFLLGSILSDREDPRTTKGEQIMDNGKDNNEGQSSLPELSDEFRTAITRLVEATEQAQQAPACVDALVQHLGKLGIEDIDADYARNCFQRASEGGRLVERCMDSWDENVCDIRYPVACCHVITGTLPGDFMTNTVATISLYDRDGTPLAHDAVEWADFASTELTDEESHGGFSTAIRQAAARLGARSLFKFYDGVLGASVSIAHDPEQGATWFHERSYGRWEKEQGDEGESEGERSGSPETQAAGGAGQSEGQPS